MAKTKTPYQAAPAKTRRAVDAYYKTLKEFDFQGAIHEGAVSTAFQTLLTEVGRKYKWTLIPQLGDKQDGRHIRPDGTMKDRMLLVRGHWEAKDTNDDLDVEIKAKIAKNYPLGNIIFEDTQRGVLIQNANEALRADLTDPDELVCLLEAFFAYVEPQIESFEKAVAEFKERVPELARALKAKIEEAHKSNKPFKEAFAAFFQLCQASLNPNLSKDAIDDMLVQHLLTERLIRKVFDNPEFTRRNVIAVEIEKVISALTSKAFNRAEFLRSLDRFYVAIENAARTITGWSDKQHFLNTVYEQFFQGYSVKLADTMGIVYTPQPIVDFMCASVAEVLQKEFGKTLGSRDVNILDPCTGTGNFIVNLMRRIPKRDLPRVYRHQLFANEVMLLPYYIAALNIEHAYYEQSGAYEPFEGLCFVDTLDLTEAAQAEMAFMTERNAERVERQRRTPITVIIGNPPYNMGQVNENDNNKNRKYEHVDERIRSTFARDSRATLKNKLYDPYVKFVRWAIDRLRGRPGIVCFVTNNSFFEQVAFDGMRKHLWSEFTHLWHIDLHGNVRENPRLSGTTHNVFGIQVGVGITLAIRGLGDANHTLRYHRVPEDWRREDKLQWLSAIGSMSRAPLEQLTPDLEGTWLTLAHAGEFQQMIAIADKETKRQDAQHRSVFALFSLGLATNRDHWAYSFEQDDLESKIKKLIRNFNSEVFRLRGEESAPLDLDAWVNNDPRFLKWTDRLKNALQSGELLKYDPGSIRKSQYRPYAAKLVYFDALLNQRRYQQHHIFPTAGTERENVVIWCKSGGDWPFFALASRSLVDLLPQGGSQCFPFYIYDEDGSNRRDNITDWALKEFRSHYKSNKITKWDIFHYVYGLLHHPGYREKFVDNLKRELPRIPYAQDFYAFSNAGKRLAKLHLDYEELEPWPLEWIEADGVPLSYRVKKMRLNKDKTCVKVNESLTLGEIPPEVFEYRLGNRSALDWVIDQYRIKTDTRSDIESDPNREDDSEYIVRLVGQVVRVSMETVPITQGLPDDFGG